MIKLSQLYIFYYTQNTLLHAHTLSLSLCLSLPPWSLVACRRHCYGRLVLFVVHDVCKTRLIDSSTSLRFGSSSNLVLQFCLTQIQLYRNQQSRLRCGSHAAMADIGCRRRHSDANEWRSSAYRYRSAMEKHRRENLRIIYIYRYRYVHICSCCSMGMTLWIY